MTTTSTPTTPPDWSDIERRRPIEDLITAPSADACFAYVLEAVATAEVPSVEVLIEALAAAKICGSDHSSHFRRGIEAVLTHEEFRPALMLALALRGMPGAASEVSAAFAVLALDLSLFLIEHGPGASTQAQVDIARSLSSRIEAARMATVGWAVLASGRPATQPEIPLTATAIGFGSYVDDGWTGPFRAGEFGIDDEGEAR